MNELAVLPKYDLWQMLLDERREVELMQSLSKAPLVDIAAFITRQEPQTVLGLLSLFQGEDRATLFTNLDEKQKMAVYAAISKQAIADIFAFMPSDQRADFYQQLDEKEQTALLPYLSKRVRKDVITLSAYPPDVAGGIMHTDFATVQEGMTVQEALRKLREDAPSKKMMYYIYVLNADMQMVGIVSLKDLIMAELEDQTVDIVHHNFIYANVYEDRESVAQKIEKYDLAAVPVLNERGQLMGIVGYDEAMDVIRAEQTEDMEKFMGIVSGDTEEDYLATSSVQHFRRRVKWITGLFVASFVSGMVLRHYEGMLHRLPILMFYLSSINDAGGNAGSQAASVVIRALSLGQITLRSWLTIVFKEAKVAVMLSACLFVLAVLKVAVVSGNSTSAATPPGMPSLYKIAFVIAFSLSLQVITATIIGAMLPLVAKFFKGDPAVAASPAITTIVDITGMAIYLLAASYFLLS